MASTAPTRVLGRLQRAGLTFLFALAIVFGAVVGILLAYETDLPQISSLEDFEPNIITQVYNVDGSLLGEFSIERRVVVGFKDIPPVLRNAVVSVEDAEFWKHLGVNLWRIPAAAFVEARRGRGAWRLASAASGAGMLGLFVLAGAGFSGRPVPGGLYQRLSLGIGLGWVTALMLRER